MTVDQPGKFILDVSVMGKWFNLDEENRKEALIIRELHSNGDNSLLAPSIILYEMFNLIWKNKAHPEDEFDKLISLIMSLSPVRIELSKEQVLRALRIGRERYLPYYDCAYLTLAEYFQIPLLTADENQNSSGWYRAME